MSQTPIQPPEPPEPPDQDRLAELLERCLRAEREAPGSASNVIRDAPHELRDELTHLLAAARALEAAEWASAPAAFRAGARARFNAIAPAAETAPSAAARPAGPSRLVRRAAPWLVRVAAGVAALALAGYGSVAASVGSLPGQPLYAVKQADEFVTLSLTRDDVTRALVLLQQAGVRLDEASRLSESGQTQAAMDVLRQYVVTLEGAVASLTRARGLDPQTRDQFDTQLQQQLGQLQALARNAPDPLRTTVDQAQVVARQELGRSEPPAAPAAAEPVPSPTVSPSPVVAPSSGVPNRPPASPSALSSPVVPPTRGK